MGKLLSLDDLRRARDAQDPELVDLVGAVAGQPDYPPDTQPREGALTFQKVLQEIRGYAFRKKSFDEQTHRRRELLQAVEATDAEVQPGDKLKLHQVILGLWEDADPFARRCLLGVIATVPLVYGPWKAIKRIFKEAEAKNDLEVLAALTARLDMAYASGKYQTTRETMAYMVRRAWRYLRRLGQRLPACYPDAAVEVLSHYTDETRWRDTWVANHIFYHEARSYTRARFHVPHGSNLLQHRAFAELWQRTPRPLFSLLERAKSEQVWEFATTALRTDFRSTLREVEPAWVARLVNVGSKTIDEFVVWILTNVPRFEQGAFRSLGLHEPVLRLFDSPSHEARVYAAQYARTHARDLPVSELIRLANNDNETIRKLAADLLQSRDPRTEIGLEAWGQLLETQYGHPLAAAVLRKSFGARELTPEWFKARLFSDNAAAINFAKSHLPQVHPFAKLGVGYFVDLLDSLSEPSGATAYNVPAFALGELARFDLNALDADFLRRLLLNPLTQQQVIQWVNEGRLHAKSLSADFLKVVAYHLSWEGDPWLEALRKRGREWAKDLHYVEFLGDRVLEWLKDPRRFTPADLGFDWLMQLVARIEERYHDFAVDTMVKSFRPADFAPRDTTPTKAAAAAPGKADLGGASFLFTGKLATMTRKDAEEAVKNAGGVALSAVTNKLHYLVVGDEGSPLYGQGKKGAKQVKAEELNAAGGNIRIISETAFLQMLRGELAGYSDDAVLAGCERLWEMATAPGKEDVALGRFARRYIRRHHSDIAVEETDKPVDPGAEIPQSFFTFARVEPLLHETRKPLREFALKIARWEFARWAPPVGSLVRLAEAPFSEVREFLGQALLADEAPEHKRYRIDPATLTPAAVYSFCESADEGTRELGMQLIQRHAHLRVPEELFRLTESPDRKVRAFVIRTLWALYRDRGITRDWKPTVPPQATVGAAARQQAATAAETRGSGAPARPGQLPATKEEMTGFFRRVLFEIPPAGAEGGRKDGETVRARLRPLPARKAKLSLVEIMRDLALEDAAFAEVALPGLVEFLDSRGPSEQAACLVAVTRIRHRYPQFATT